MASADLPHRIPRFRFGQSEDREEPMASTSSQDYNAAGPSSATSSQAAVNSQRRRRRLRPLSLSSASLESDDDLGLSSASKRSFDESGVSDSDDASASPRRSLLSDGAPKRTRLSTASSRDSFASAVSGSFHSSGMDALSTLSETTPFTHDAPMRLAATPAPVASTSRHPATFVEPPPADRPWRPRAQAPFEPFVDQRSQTPSGPSSSAQLVAPGGVPRLRRRESQSLSLAGQLPAPSLSFAIDGPWSPQRPSLSRNRTAVSPPELTPPIMLPEEEREVDAEVNRLMDDIRLRRERRRAAEAAQPVASTSGETAGERMIRLAAERDANWQSLRDALHAPRPAQPVADERPSSRFRTDAWLPARRALRPQLDRSDTPPAQDEPELLAPPAPWLSDLPRLRGYIERSLSPTPPSESTSLWGEVRGEGSSQSRPHRFGALAAGRLRGPTRASNEQWLARPSASELAEQSDRPSRFRSTRDWLRQGPATSLSVASTSAAPVLLSRSEAARRAEDVARDEESRQSDEDPPFLDFPTGRRLPLISPRRQLRPLRTPFDEPDQSVDNGSYHFFGRARSDWRPRQQQDAGVSLFGANRVPWRMLRSDLEPGIAFDARNWASDDDFASYEAMLGIGDLLGEARRKTATAQEIARDEGLDIKSAKELLVNGETRCPICLCDYEADDQLRVLKCKHAFHVSCCDQWLMTACNSCPTCRATAADVQLTPPPV